MNKIKVFLITIVPLFISVIIIYPHIRKNYQNYKNERIYLNLEKELNNLIKDKDIFLQEKNDLEERLLLLENVNSKKSTLQNDIMLLNKEIKDINNSISDYEKKINNEKQKIKDIEKYVIK